jgi:hypothetical protein
MPLPSERACAAAEVLRLVRRRRDARQPNATEIAAAPPFIYMLFTPQPLDEPRIQ